MADESTTPDPTDDATASTDEGTTETTTDETLGETGKAALESERKARRDAEKAAKDLQKRLKALEDAGKSEDERQSEAFATLERERDEALLELARHRAAVTYGLEPEDLEFLTGDPDEIDERAKKLATRLGRAGKPAKPKADPTQGNRTGAPDENASALGVLGF